MGTGLFGAIGYGCRVLNMTHSKHSKYAFDRRQFLRGSAAGMASLSLRTLATGLPASFLLAGHVPAHAQSLTPKTLVLAVSNLGESINCHAPGTYSSDPNDYRSQIERARVAELGADVKGSINGNDVTVEDFSESANFKLGDTDVEAARYLSYLPQDLLDRTAFIHLRTSANGHPEHARVRRVNEALLGENGRGNEQIQSAIMQEMLTAGLNNDTLFNRPMMLRGAGSFTYESTPLASYGPSDVKDLFIGSSTVTAELENMNKVYNAAIDSIYKDIKSSGTSAQMNYLDAHAASRESAIRLGDELGDLLTDVTGNSSNDQLRAAVAMAKVNLSPVIVVEYTFSGDNHGDTNLTDDVDLTIEHMNGLETFWSLLKQQGLEDQVNYATWDVFGRTFGRNSSGGRDHHNSHCVNMMIGTQINAGVLGDIEAYDFTGTRMFRAAAFNSTTGQTANPDIAGTETLAAYARTLMAYMGISEDRIDYRLPVGKTITAAFKS